MSLAIIKASIRSHEDMIVSWTGLCAAAAGILSNASVIATTLLAVVTLGFTIDRWHYWRKHRDLDRKAALDKLERERSNDDHEP